MTKSEIDMLFVDGTVSFCKFVQLIDTVFTTMQIILQSAAIE